MLADKLRSAMVAEKLFVDDVFSTWLYTGNGSTQTITNGIDLAGKGGLVWEKNRSAAQDHYLVDSARPLNDVLRTNTIGTPSSPWGGYAFNGNGYSSGLNFASGNQIVGWTFRKAPKFFDVHTVSHTNGAATNINLSSLGTVGKVIAKITNTTGDWIVWHRSLTAGNNLRLNTTVAQTPTNAWLSVSGTTATLSASAPTGTYVIYAWAHDTSADGVIQCGSATSDGSRNLIATLGWEPQYVLLKNTTRAGAWIVVDSMRGFLASKSGDQSSAPHLQPNSSNVEANDNMGVNATGFTRGQLDVAGDTYIYLAIRRPNKPPTTGTQVYNAIARTGTGAAATVTGVGFAPDLHLGQTRSVGGNHQVFTDRLRGAASGLASNSTAAESSFVNYLSSLNQNGISYVGANGNDSSWTFINHFFRRAPGFMDVVCYTGNNSSPQTVTHSLGATPELLIVKNRSFAHSSGWSVACAYLASTKAVVLNADFAEVNATSSFNDTRPTATQFTVGSDHNSSSHNYVAYLFASLPGISKVGSYTGNGSSQTINCGFTTGARFILIKRTDLSGDWFVWDTARGIVAGNDPRLSLNTTAAEVTTLDTIDTNSTGFIVNQDSSNVNVNGAVYIWLAIS